MESDFRERSILSVFASLGFLCEKSYVDQPFLAKRAEIDMDISIYGFPEVPCTLYSPCGSIQ